MNLLPNQIEVPGGVRIVTTAGVSEGVALVVTAAAAAVPAAAVAAIGTGRQILRGAAPPHQEQGHLDVVPAKEKRDPKLIVAGRGMALRRLAPPVRSQREQLERRQVQRQR
jgi:hypothetical protein